MMNVFNFAVAVFEGCRSEHQLANSALGYPNRDVVVAPTSTKNEGANR